LEALDVEQLFTTENLAALATLTALEIVLGIDNIVFISILAGKLPEDRRARARTVGLLLAMFMRIALLLGISWVMGLTAPLFTIPVVDHEISGRDLILIVGGAFLIFKATREIHDKLEGSHETLHQPKSSARFASVIAQIIAMDIIFSLDSVITAVGMVKVPLDPATGDPVEGGRAAAITIMIIAIMISIGVMLVFASAIGRFIEKHPTIKMLALAFLILIGVVLVADGFHQHVSKGYIYSAIVFSLFVEMLNLRAGKVRVQAPASM
jgi:predicted tellurium resistance membrane protein TerC